MKQTSRLWKDGVVPYQQDTNLRLYSQITNFAIFSDIKHEKNTKICKLKSRDVNKATQSKAKAINHKAKARAI